MEGFKISIISNNWVIASLPILRDSHSFLLFFVQLLFTLLILTQYKVRRGFSGSSFETSRSRSPLHPLRQHHRLQCPYVQPSTANRGLEEPTPPKKVSEEDTSSL